MRARHKGRQRKGGGVNPGQGRGSGVPAVDGRPWLGQHLSPTATADWLKLHSSPASLHFSWLSSRDSRAGSGSSRTALQHLMSLFRRNAHPDDELDTDDEITDAIDPELRLRTVRTAASTIAESIRQEQRAERRKSTRKKGSRFFRRGTEKRRQDTADSDTPTSQPNIHGRRRNVYVNMPLPPDEQDSRGEPIVRYARNKVRTSSAYLSTFPICTL